MSQSSMSKILMLFLLLLVYGCSSEPAGMFGSTSNSFSTSLKEQQLKKNKYLAYSHSISVRLEKNKLPIIFKSVVDTCVSDTEHSCIIMHSSHRGGKYASGNISLRVAPEGVSKYKALVSGAGDVEQQSTTAEDLTDSIVDTETRIEMLESYREKLKELEKNPNINIDSLIKVSSEISEVQTKLEYAQGQKAKLYQQINMDVLNISLETEVNESFISPISDALSEFGEDFSEGIAIFITTTAYLIPWGILLVIFVWLVRIVWRRSKREK